MASLYHYRVCVYQSLSNISERNQYLSNISDNLAAVVQTQCLSPTPALVRIKTISLQRVKYNRHWNAVTNKEQLFGAIHEHLFAKIS